MRVARLRSLVLLAVTMALGLTTRSGQAWIPEFIARFGGDTLWASALFWALRLLWPRPSALRIAVIAGAVSLAVELSQLSSARWLEAIRSTRLGMLAIGNGFLYSDLLCYAVGVALAFGIDRQLGRKAR